MKKIIVICGRCLNDLLNPSRPIPERIEKENCSLCGKHRFCIVGRIEVDSDEQ